MQIVEGTEKYLDEIKECLRKEWFGPMMAMGGELYDASLLPGLVCLIDEKMAGFALYRIKDSECELAELYCVVENQGVGKALLQKLAKMAREKGCTRLWLLTTNDNIRALRFYQRQGMRLSALYVNGMAVNRKLKPQIKEMGLNGIPQRDEIELEMML